MTTLNTIEIMDVNPWVYYLLIADIVMGVLSIILTIIFDFNTKTACILLVLCAICFIAAILGIHNLTEVPTGRFQIEATFTDDFPFTSVMKEYDVIEQRGDIFLLEPKEREVG